jgi:hypothetical protein
VFLDDEKTAGSFRTRLPTKKSFAELTGIKFKVINEFESMPFMAVELDGKALSVLDKSDRVRSVTDERYRPQPTRYRASPRPY